MLKAFLDSLEDPKRPLLGPNIWIAKISGFILPDDSIQKWFWMVYHIAGALFVISQFVELYFIRIDLDQVLTNLNISMLSAICLMKCCSYIFYQKSWMELIDYVTEADIFERQTEDPVKRKILEKYTKYSRTMTYIYWLLLAITSSVTLGTPIVQYASHRVSSSHGGNSQNETDVSEPAHFRHMFSSWMPFDKNHWPGNWITVAWHLIACYYGTVTICSFDTMAMVFMTFFGGKLDLFRERCKELFGKDSLQISDEEATSRVGELHQIYVNILK